MRKSDKKIENSLRVSLTQVCEQALEQVEGFEWITHLVNYDNFPQSLKIICVFDTNEHLSAATVNKQDVHLIKLIQKALSQASIKVNDLSAKVSFDTEENCSLQNDGKWNIRLG
ncbi:Fis family transcriptional regulator [Shewanella eurypsychrophilus]|uniref:Fis family transcriptional regulator n=1 Tax=Shewanella eurypsychrophilus TaxID=2593656 RepID=A0ABX6VD11_9GAMM|nr:MULTISPECIES: Fis family transcriptional regulator [Shewanella]QFU24234.1 Fis family transcriptional regulator [Shewanella sp. YLB-09]QPG59439.1 Fis family transcriptional regulator [Shewanella eurypsychrophilus]